MSTTPDIKPGSLIDTEVDEPEELAHALALMLNGYDARVEVDFAMNAILPLLSNSDAKDWYQVGVSIRKTCVTTRKNRVVFVQDRAEDT